MRSAHRLLLCSIASLIGFAALDRAAAADEFSAAPCTIQDGENGVLLLQDGGVLTGQITHAADWYVVTRAGGQMQVSALRVQFIGHSLHEVYEFRRDRISHDPIEAKLVLADWCLRHSLLVDAGDTLAAVNASDPGNPRLTLLQRRLTAAQTRPAATTTAVANSVSRQQPLSNDALATPAVSPDLPAGVLEQFTRKVQPVLVNNCTISKCHELGGPQSFQLNRASVRGEANRRTTMQNLAATLALVDRDTPSNSPLLVVPRQTHGGMSAPVFGPRQDQAFKHVAEWVALISPPPKAEESPDGGEDSPNATASAGAATAAAKASASTSPPAALVAPPTKAIARNSRNSRTKKAPPKIDPAVQPASATEEVKPPSLRGPHRLKIGATAEKWQPRDEFDPEIFNRAQQAGATLQVSAKPNELPSPMEVQPASHSNQ